MTTVTIRHPNQDLLRWTWRLLFACGILLLGYCGFMIANTWQFQRNESREFSNLLLEQQSSQSLLQQQSSQSPLEQQSSQSLLQQPAPGATGISPPPATATEEQQGLIGRIELQRLGLSVIVMEGSDERTLNRAAGHIAGTSLPGEPGNTAISAHRDTLFRALKGVRRDDILTMTTLDGEFRYRVVQTKVVEPSDLSVLDSDGSEVLTLVTCYPFYFIGPAPERFVVRAERVY